MGDVAERRLSKPSNNRGAAALGGLRGRRHQRVTARRASGQSEALSAEPRVRPQGSAYREPTPRGCRPPMPDQRRVWAMRSAVTTGGNLKQLFGRSDDSG